MILKRILFTAASCFFAMVVSAQAPAPNDLPIVVPPSPELASLAKVGELTTSLHTGAASVNIPLFQMTAGTIKLPIALSYSTNGIRVNDIASRVGLGWNLVAGGFISRTIHDEDDLNATWLSPPASFLPDSANTALYPYLFDANQPNFDTEKDEYSFSVNGLSGKFFIDTGGIPRLMSHSNVQIIKNGSSFSVIDAQGTKYLFGGTGYEEKTNGYTTNGVGRENKASQTGWFLKKVETPEGDYINFTYAPITIETIQGPSQTMILTTTAGQQGTAGFCNISNPCTGSWKAVMMNEVKYNTRYLTQITASSGQIIYFTYTSRNAIVDDEGGDNRLSDIKIDQAATPVTTQLKRYHLEYEDFSIANDKNQRFYLKKLFTHSREWGDSAHDELLVHKFEYNDQSLPSQKSLGQDYFGYSNTKDNNTAFAPRPNPDPYFDHNGEIADRGAVFSGMIKGSLSKVIFPTGGYEKFNYEQHTKGEAGVNTTYSSLTLQGPGKSGTNITPNIYTGYFTTNSYISPRINIAIECFNNLPDTSFFFPDAHHLYELNISKVSNNSGITQYNLNEYTEVNYSLGPTVIDVNTLYKVELKVFSIFTYGRVTIQYSPVDHPIWLNTPASGIRVNNIEAFDPVSNKVQTKYYRYASIADLTKSTGVGPVVPDCSANYPGGGTCIGNPNGTGTYGTQITCTNLVQLSSSSLSGTFTFGGSPIAYSTVTESDDPNFVNGATEHTFYTSYDDSRPTALVGTMMPACPQNLSADMNGMETTTKWFKKSGSNFILLKKTDNVYRIDNRVSHVLNSYVNRQKWEPLSGIPLDEKLKAYDCGKYQYSSRWFHLDTTYTVEYDQDGIVPMYSFTAYEYNNTAHTMPTKITTTDSRGDTILQQTKYPVDYEVAPYTDMVSKHILSPVIESKSTKAGTLLNIVRTDYKDWGDSGKLFRPEVINMQTGDAAEEPRLRYHAYQPGGNPLEVSKEDGVHVSYIWDYLNNFPTAEVKNAGKDDIAYTSFETGDYGNWTTDGAIIDGTTDYSPIRAFAGTKFFIGTLTKTVSADKTYTVTLWAKGSGATVNSAQGTLIQTKRGWDLLQWRISGATSIVVDGGMDEVRLYPNDAMMTTYLYSPFTGISLVADPSNTYRFYKYDGMGRLAQIDDIDRNILKKYEYKYNVPIAPCADTSAVWEVTGIEQCATDSINNFTGIKNAQERNVNNCSPTYLNTRWVTITTPTGECLPMPGCTGPDKRWIGSPPVCTTGTKVLVSSVKVGSTWYCTWKYVWSDGFESATFQTTGAGKCLEIIEL